MPNLVIPVQQDMTIIEIWPYRNGWQRLEASGVRQSAIDYAKALAKFGRGEIRVLNADGSVKDVIRLDKSTPKL